MGTAVVGSLSGLVYSAGLWHILRMFLLLKDAGHMEDDV